MQPFQSTRRFDQSVQQPSNEESDSQLLVGKFYTHVLPIIVSWEDLREFLSCVCPSWQNGPGIVLAWQSNRWESVLRDVCRIWAFGVSFSKARCSSQLFCSQILQSLSMIFTSCVHFCMFTNLSPQPPPTHPPENAASPWESVYSWLKVQRIDTIGRVIDVRMEHEQCTLNAIVRAIRQGSQQMEEWLWHVTCFSCFADSSLVIADFFSGLLSGLAGCKGTVKQVHVVKTKEYSFQHVFGTLCPDTVDGRNNENTWDV